MVDGGLIDVLATGELAVTGVQLRTSAVMNLADGSRVGKTKCMQ